MQLQTAELRAVQPQNMVDGFDIEVIRHDENLIAGQIHAEYLCNRFVQINIRCDGTNPGYPHRQSLTVLVTKYCSPNETVGIVLKSNANVGGIILKWCEILHAIGVYELKQDGVTSPVLILQIKNTQTAHTYTAVYALTPKIQQRH